MTHPRCARRLTPSQTAAVERARKILFGAGLNVDPDQIVPFGPSWAPGDVILVRFGGPSGQAFTYVRGATGWLVDGGPQKTDAEMTSRYAKGEVTLLLRAEGQPWPGTATAWRVNPRPFGITYEDTL